MILSQSSLFFVSLACSTVVTAAKDGSSRPRGVGPEFAKFYKDPNTFTCISHPAVQIPFSSVNDDYCDCPDGSDEPGTSACSHLSHHSPLTVADRPGNNDLELTSALPGFYCKNKGHRPSYVPFQRVNDGICDYSLCCDGSDEWARVGGIKCEDRCKEIGKEWRKKEEKRQKSMTAALKKKKDLLVDAGRQQKEIEDHIKDLETELAAQELKTENLGKDLEAVQNEEQAKVKDRKKGKVNILAELAKGRVEELRGALVEVRQERDDTHSRVKELEDILSKFKEEYNPNFNDEGVKRAVRSWEEYAARGLGDDGNRARDRDLNEIAKADGENSGVNWEHWENEEDSCELDTIYQLGAYLPPSLVSFLENQFLAFRGFLEKRGVLSKREIDSGPESQAVKDAREALQSAQKTLKEIQNHLRDQRADLEIDYGPASVFRALKGECITRDAGEYTYEHCFLDQTKQNSKKGGASLRMGKFERIGQIHVDEVNEAGEIVPVERMSLEYARGQTCWNGPSRSTKVILECGEENEILKVAEDEKCVYSMLVSTPAVCAGGEEEGAAPRRKDEL